MKKIFVIVLSFSSIFHSSGQMSVEGMKLGLVSSSSANMLLTQGAFGLNISEKINLDVGIIYILLPNWQPHKSIGNRLGVLVNYNIPDLTNNSKWDVHPQLGFRSYYSSLISPINIRETDATVLKYPIKRIMNDCYAGLSIERKVLRKLGIEISSFYGFSLEYKKIDQSNLAYEHWRSAKGMFFKLGLVWHLQDK